MATTMGTHDRDRRGDEHNHWGVAMAIGIFLIVAGGFALFAAVLTSLVSVIYLGVLLMIVGVLEIVSAFRVHHAAPVLVYLLAGILAVLAGALLLYRPVASLLSLTLLIAGYLFAGGLFRGVTAVVVRHPRWGWDLAYALVAVALGALVVIGWPFSSFWALGTFVAAEIIARGVTLVAAGWLLRDLEHEGMPGRFAGAH